MPESLKFTFRLPEGDWDDDPRGLGGRLSDLLARQSAALLGRTATFQAASSLLPG
jgi:hypothetical protein